MARKRSGNRTPTKPASQGGGGSASSSRGNRRGGNRGAGYSSKAGCDGGAVVATLDGDLEPRPPALPSLSLRAHLLLALTVFFPSLSLYRETLHNDFVFDDHAAVVTNPDVRGERPLSRILESDFWGSPLESDGSHKSYRPLTTLAFRIAANRYGAEPRPFHLINNVLNGMACALSVLCLVSVAPRGMPRTRTATTTADDPGTKPPSTTTKTTTTTGSGFAASSFLSFPVVSAVLFAFHPIHTEAVASVVGQADMLSAIFAFLAFAVHSLSMPRVTVTALVSPILVKSSEEQKEQEEEEEDQDRWWQTYCLPASIALAWASALSKETGLTILGLCGAHEVSAVWLPLLMGSKSQSRFVHVDEEESEDDAAVASRKKKRRARATLLASTERFAYLALSGIAYLALRFHINGPRTSLVPSPKDNPLLTAETSLSYGLTAAFVMALYVWRLIDPFPLLCDYGYDVVPLVEGFKDARNLATLSVLLGTLALAVPAARDAAGLSKATEGAPDGRLLLALAWIYVPLLPGSHVLTLGTVLAERLLYLPSLGFCMLVALAVERLLLLSAGRGETSESGDKAGEGPGTEERNGSGSKPPSSASSSPPSSPLVRPALSALVAVLGLYARRVVTRVPQWAGSDTLWKADHATNPRNVKIALSRAKDLLAGGDADEAYRIVRSQKALGRVQEVELCITKAHVTAVADAAGNDFAEAHRILDACIADADAGIDGPTVVDGRLFSKKGYLLSEEGRADEARPWFERAERYGDADGKKKDFHAVCNAGQILAREHEWEESIPRLEECVERSAFARTHGARHVVHVVNLAKALYMTRRMDEAEVVLGKAQDIFPTEEATVMQQNVKKWLEWKRKKDANGG